MLPFILFLLTGPVILFWVSAAALNSPGRRILRAFFLVLVSLWHGFLGFITGALLHLDYTMQASGSAAKILEQLANDPAARPELPSAGPESLLITGGFLLLWTVCLTAGTAIALRPFAGWHFIFYIALPILAFPVAAGTSYDWDKWQREQTFRESFIRIGEILRHSPASTAEKSAAIRACRETFPVTYENAAWQGIRDLPEKISRELETKKGEPKGSPENMQ